MKKIVLAGERHAGKSLLAYALCKYLKKNGVDCHTVNLDPGVKHLKHLPAFDVRKTISVSMYPELSKDEASEKIMLELNYHALDKEFNKIQAQVLLIDSAFSIGEVLTTKLDLFQYADCVLLVTTAEKIESKKDELVLKSIGEIASFKQELPCAVLVNKSDLRPVKRRKIFDYSFTEGSLLESFDYAPLAYCSALEKVGLKEISELINDLTSSPA